jgi:hypothetical protein
MAVGELVGLFLVIGLWAMILLFVFCAFWGILKIFREEEKDGG